jgi:AcrR family transcriptional regulator
MAVMPRLVRSPQALIEQLLRLVPIPHPLAASPGPAPGPGTEERILDAALAAFSAHGIRATTMSQLARDVGISREWLYKHFRNRDAVVLSVTQREVLRFIDGLAHRAYDSDHVEGAVIEAFVYSVEFLRDHALLQRVLDSEADLLSLRMVLDAAPIVGIAVQTFAGYLSAVGDLPPEEAALVADTLVRLVGTITLVPRSAVDLHDPALLRRYAAAVVPAVLASSHAMT